MPKLIRFPATALACFTAAIVLAGTASAGTAGGNPITPSVSWPLIIFTHATQISSVKHLWLNPFFRVAESHGWLKPSWYWTGIDAGFELWKGGQGLRVSYFNVNS
jgi:hypothetical protein